MSKLIYVPIIVGLLLCVSIFVCVTVYKKKHDAVAEEMLKKTIQIVEKYYSLNIKYPDKLSELSEFEGIKKNVMVIFNPPKIYYHKINGFYNLSYYMFPVGPFYGYEKKTNEWFYEE